MSLSIILKTHGYEVNFLLNPQAAGEGFNATIELDVITNEGSYQVSSISTFLFPNDLRVLMTYLKNHIRERDENLITESDTYVPLELGFQIHALSGEFLDNADLESAPAVRGDFTIRFMVNIGRSKISDTNLYMGVEGLVDVEAIENFIAQLNELMNF